MQLGQPALPGCWQHHSGVQQCRVAGQLRQLSQPAVDGIQRPQRQARQQHLHVSGRGRQSLHAGPGRHSHLVGMHAWLPAADPAKSACQTLQAWCCWRSLSCWACMWETRRLLSRHGQLALDGYRQHRAFPDWCSWQAWTWQDAFTPRCSWPVGRVSSHAWLHCACKAGFMPVLNAMAA